MSMMKPRFPDRRRALVGLAAAAPALLLVAACASTQLGAQWVDNQVPKQALQGATILVVCEAQDTTVRLLCETEFGKRIGALGAKSMTPATLPGAPAGGDANADALLAAAKAAGARAVLRTTLRPDYSAPSSTPSFSFGIGGFGGSGGGSGVGGGVGVAMPVGATGGAGMAGSSTLNDVAGGRVIWSAQATAPASSDLSAQVNELTTVLVGAIQQSGLF